MALGPATLQTLNQFAKINYNQAAFEKQSFQISPLLGLIQKVPNTGGRGFATKVRRSMMQGGGVNVTSALANRSSAIDVEFNFQTADEYFIASMDAKALTANNGGANSIKDAYKEAMDDSFNYMARAMSHNLFRNAGKARGRAASFTGSTITLTDRNDAIYFAEDMIVQAKADDGTTAGAAKAGTLTVQGVDFDLGIITFTTPVATGIATFAAQDFLFRNGDVVATGNGTGANGLAGWIPITPPNATPFGGVDRSGNPVMLAGVRYVAPGGESKIDTVFKAAQRLFVVSQSKLDFIALHPQDYDDIQLALQGKGVVMMLKDRSGTIMYETLSIQTDGGNASFLRDANCPRGFAWLLNKDSWRIRHLNEIPHVAKEDGQTIRLGATDDNLTWRMRAWWNLECLAPFKNAVLQFG